MKTPFRFDGHGINDAEGQRIAKVSSCEPYTYDTGTPQRNAEFDNLSNMFAAAPEMLAALEKLVDWAQYMGGWDAVVWKQARQAIAKAKGQ